MNYFRFYGIPVSFLLDPVLLKNKFLEASKKYHPDFFVNEPDEKQAEVLELSTLNTRAFQTLSDFDKRMEYVLETNNLISEGEKYELHPEFLMEMMEFNEELMELQGGADEDSIKMYKEKLKKIFDDLYEAVRTEIENYTEENSSTETLKKIKDYYYRKKYLLRIQRSLDTFAGL